MHGMIEATGDVPSHSRPGKSLDWKDGYHRGYADAQAGKPANVYQDVPMHDEFEPGAEDGQPIPAGMRRYRVKSKNPNKPLQPFVCFAASETDAIPKFTRQRRIGSEHTSNWTYDVQLLDVAPPTSNPGAVGNAVANELRAAANRVEAVAVKAATEEFAKVGA